MKLVAIVAAALLLPLVALLILTMGNQPLKDGEYWADRTA